MEDDRTLKLTRQIAAPRMAIWRCWTEPALLMQWFCPQPWRVSRAELDLRPGGRCDITMMGPDGQEMPNPGVYLELDPGRRLVATDAFAPGWRPSAGTPFMVLELNLSDEAGGTRYEAMAHHWTLEAKAQHEQMGFHEGWGKATDQLEALVATLR